MLFDRPKWLATFSISDNVRSLPFATVLSINEIKRLDLHWMLAWQPSLRETFDQLY